jgi:putative endonuclease
MYKVYILESQADHSYYIGYTSDLNNRLVQHNKGESRYTSNKRPWKLVYYETFATKSEAIKREKFLKKQRNRKFYQSLIDTWMDRT